MRGNEKQQAVMFSYIDLDERVPAEHPLRAIRQMVDQALADLRKAAMKVSAFFSSL